MFVVPKAKQMQDALSVKKTSAESDQIFSLWL